MVQPCGGHPLCTGIRYGTPSFPHDRQRLPECHQSGSKEQILKAEGKLPAAVVACVGGGSNAMGAFYNFIDDKDVELIGCEAAGKGVDTALTAATIATDLWEFSME